MGPQTVVTRCINVLESEVEGEVVALDVDHGRCFAFNSTATRVWQLLERPGTLMSICDQLTAAHDVDHETCMAEVGAMLDGLAADGLVLLSDQP